MVKTVAKRRHSVRLTKSKGMLRRRARAHTFHPREMNKVLGAKSNVISLYMDKGFSRKTLGKPEMQLKNTNKSEIDIKMSREYEEPLILEHKYTELPEWKEKKIQQVIERKNKAIDMKKPEGIKKSLLSNEDRVMMEQLIARFGDDIHLMSLDSKINKNLYNSQKLKKIYKLYNIEKGDCPNSEQMNTDTSEKKPIRRRLDPCTERLFKKVPRHIKNQFTPKIEMVDVRTLLAHK